MKHRILVVVPTLNSYVLLPRLLESLQAQTFPNWRLLFIDGHSGVEHREWLERCCAGDSRCSWLNQDPSEIGIFGAMDQGFSYASCSDWLLFWGSDDWAASPTVFLDLIASLEEAETHGIFPDMIVCHGSYADSSSGVIGRRTFFQRKGLFSTSSYRRHLFFGSTPPHQATLIGPGARQRLASYAPGFRLSADLDYFLQLSRHPGLRVQCLDLELVHMADGGVSGQQTQRRLQEVRRAYRRVFGWYWWFPFLMRYFRRVASLLEWSR